MDSSFRTERTATATTAGITTMAATTATIRSTFRPSMTAGRPTADARHDGCWCGQDMDVVRGNHCPRCGTMRVARVGAVLPRLAA
jgi:hypothetical protein